MLKQLGSCFRIAVSRLHSAHLEAPPPFKKNYFRAYGLDQGHQMTIESSKSPFPEMCALSALVLSSLKSGMNTVKCACQSYKNGFIYIQRSATNGERSGPKV